MEEIKEEIKSLKAIALKATEVCKWIGWMEHGDCRAIHAVEELKKEIEKYTGQDLMEYT